MSQQPVFLVFEPFLFGLPGAFFLVAPPALYLFLLFFVFPRTVPRTVGQILAYARWRDRHNLAIGVFSLVVLILTMFEMAVEAVDAMKHKAGMIDVWVCQEESRSMRIINFVFVASKLWEMLDTGFLVWLKNDAAHAVLKSAKSLNSNQVVCITPEMPIFLHAFHHATTILAYILVMSLPGGPKFGCILNSLVHTFMYLNYAGVIKLRGMWKSMLTAAQIVQFLIVIAIWIAAPQMCDLFAAYPEAHALEYYLPFCFVPVYLILFVRFFVKTYIQ